jgi:hypothetical protein
VSQQVWHDKDPSLLKGPALNLQPFTGILAKEAVSRGDQEQDFIAKLNDGVTKMVFSVIAYIVNFSTFKNRSSTPPRVS